MLHGILPMAPDAESYNEALSEQEISNLGGRDR